MDAACLNAVYRKHYEAYCRIFERGGLRYLIVEAHSGAMGGSQSHEFMVESEAGEDFIVGLPPLHHRHAVPRSALGPVHSPTPGSTNGHGRRN
ncbi:MAG TPA: hypothetical protein VMR62_02690 [Bryobacteraceae bacterium]|jgi:prolyl-tRNA synthetase|nr:hypothetical protein [Bryobacteraceae bacterium]